MWCKVFYKRTPPDIKRYLRDLGNSKNGIAAATSFLETYQLIDDIEKAWENFRWEKNHGSIRPSRNRRVIPAGLRIVRDERFQRKV